jgi:hypothetical protein
VFKETREELIKKLEAGDFDSEPRDAMDEKNLLAIGVVSAADVVRLLRRCKGTQYSASPHHKVKKILVHIFQPVDMDRRRWYIKAYFVARRAIFISVH